MALPPRFPFWVTIWKSTLSHDQRIEPLVEHPQQPATVVVLIAGGLSGALVLWLINVSMKWTEGNVTVSLSPEGQIVFLVIGGLTGLGATLMTLLFAEVTFHKRVNTSLGVLLGILTGS